MPSLAGLSAETRCAIEAGLGPLRPLRARLGAVIRALCRAALLALGAPASLVRAAYAAGADEIGHAEILLRARLCLRRPRPRSVELPIPAALPMNPALEDVIAESVIEGCIGETLAAAQASEALLRARYSAAIAALEQTLEDEIRHAELSWRFVAWAIDHGGERARSAVARAFS